MTSQCKMVLDNVPWTWNCFLVTMTPHQIQVDLGLHSILTNLAATQPAWDSSLCPTARWSKRKIYLLKCSRCTSCLNWIVIVKHICFHFLGSGSERLKLENLLKKLANGLLSLSRWIKTLSLSQGIKTLALSQWIKTLSLSQLPPYPLGGRPCGERGCSLGSF